MSVVAAPVSGPASTLPQGAGQPYAAHAVPKSALDAASVPTATPSTSRLRVTASVDSAGSLSTGAASAVPQNGHGALARAWRWQVGHGTSGGRAIATS